MSAPGAQIDDIRCCGRHVGLAVIVITPEHGLASQGERRAEGVPRGNGQDVRGAGRR